MAKQIKHSDIAEKGLMDPTIENLKELDKILGTVIVSVKSLSRDLKKTFKAADLKTPEGVKQFKRGINDLTQIEKEYQKALKKRETIQAKMFVQEGKLGRENEKNTIRARERKKAIQAQAREELKITGAYDKQSKKLNELRKRYKNLIVEQGKETRATKKLRKEITKLANVQAKVDASVGQFQRNVGNYTKALGGLSRIIGATGLTLGFMGLFRVIGNGIRTIRDFDQANADLAAVLGKSRGEISALTEDAQRLGGETKYTATQIAGLQKELGKLGFSPDAIINMTEATQQLATAAGVELSEAAEVTGNTLRAFGLAASDTQEVVDVMARSFATSGLDMNKFRESMKLVAPSARATGRTLKDTSKLLAILANNGISGSLAGTQLNRVFVELNKEGISLEDAIKKVSAAKNGLSEATDLVGDRGAKALLIFAKNTEELNKQKVALDDVSDAAKDAAETQLDTLGGSVTLLASKWDQLIHKVNKSTGALGGLKSAIQFVTRNLESIIKWIVRGVSVWGAYRLALMLVNKETGKLKTFGIISFLKKMAVGVVSLTKGTKRAAVGIRGMGRAIKAIPFVGWIAGLTAVLPMIWDLVKGTTRAALAEERFNRAKAAGIKETEKIIEKTSTALDKRLNTEKERLKKRLEQEKGFNKEAFALRRKLTDRSIRFTRQILAVEIRAIEEKKKALYDEIREQDRNSKEGKRIMRENAYATEELEAARLKLVEKGEQAEKDSNKLLIDLNQSLTDARIAGFKKSNAAREAAKGTGTGKDSELTRLQELKKELKEVEQAREKALTTPEAQKSAEFRYNTKRQIELKDEIGFLQAILDLELKRLDFKEAEMSVNEKGLITLNQNKELAGIEGHQRAVEQAEEKAEADRLLEEQRQENITKQIEGIKSVTEVIAEEAQRRLQIQQKAIDDEISLARRRADQLSRLAERGQLEAGQSLAVEEKRIVELERKKLKAKQREQRIEASVAGFKLLADNVDKGANRPVADTIKDILQLSAVLTNLPTFYDGTEDTGKGGEGVDGKGGFQAVLHPHERVVDRKNNEAMQGLSNSELAEAAKLYNTGVNSDSYKSGQMPMQLVEHAYMSNAQILKKFDKLAETVEYGNEQIAEEIRSKPVHFFEYNNLTQSVVEGVKRSNSIEETHTKLGH